MLLLNCEQMSQIKLQFLKNSLKRSRCCCWYYRFWSFLLILSFVVIFTVLILIERYIEHTSFIKLDCSSMVVDKTSEAEFSISAQAWFNATCISGERELNTF